MPESAGNSPRRRALDLLQDEHREIERVLGLFESAIDRLRRGESVPARLLGDTIDHFQQFDVGHHAKEERRLFPLLADHGVGPEMSAVQALLAQHDTGRAYLREMREALARMAQGDRFSSFTLASTARDYIELVREHIRIEDTYVYPLASRHLTPDEDALLCEQFSDYVRRHESAGDRDRQSRMFQAYEDLGNP